MGVVRSGSCLLLAVFLWGASVFGGSSSLWAAGLKPLGDISDTLLERQVNELAESNAAAAANLQQRMEKVFAGMDMTSPEKMAEAVQVVAQARQSLTEAEKTAAELSEYVAANRGRLAGGLSRFLPLAKLKEQLEAPYYRSLNNFLVASHNLLTYAGPNFEKIGTGSPVERKRYEELYEAYARALETLNDQGTARVRRLNDWLNRHEDLRDLLPR